MSAEAAPTGPKKSPPFTILIVDDNRDFVEFIRLLLEHNGFAARWAFSGRQGLEALRGESVDLVVLDVMMPNMDGLALCRELKQTCPALPVILLTAKDDLSTRAAAMALGVSDFLAKPVNIKDFIERVRSHCQSARWNEELDAALR